MLDAPSPAGEADVVGPENPPPKPARKGVQSIEVGFSILAAMMGASRPLPLKRIAQLSGLPSNKVHSYLVSFSALNMVCQDRGSGHYRLGPFALRLGLGFLNQFDLYSATRPVMLELADAVGVTIYLGVWGSIGPTIINKVDGTLSDAILDLRVGSVLPVLRSALGRNLAAHLAGDSIRPIVAEELAQSSGPAGDGTLDDPRSPAMVERMFERIRSEGVARVRGGLLSDFSALSAPIFDHRGDLHGALTLMGRSSRFDDRVDGAAARRLKAACAAVSSACGHVPERTGREAV